MKDDTYYMELAYKEAEKAYKKNEIPIGAIIVDKGGKIISRSHNLRDSSNIVTRHAEIIAIEKANAKLNNWRLIDTTLYSTLEPCKMCSEVIKESKISKVIYAAKREDGNNKYQQINDQNIINKCSNIIKMEFKKLRNK